MKQQGILAVVSGFSGAGKGTLMKALLEKYDNYALSISATTRKPREGEVHGREYFFLSVDVSSKNDIGHQRVEATYKTWKPSQNMGARFYTWKKCFLFLP